jgi:hypothetical protein
MPQCRQGKLSLGQPDLRLRGAQIFRPRAVHEPLDDSRKLLVMRLRLSNFFDAESGFDLVPGGRGLRQQSLCLSQHFPQLKRFEFHQHVARTNVGSLFNPYLVDATTNARSDPDFVRLDESGDVQRFTPLLAVKQQRNHHCRQKDDSQKPPKHATCLRFA